MDVHQHRFFYVPVRRTGDGMDTLVIARTPEGARAGIAFSSARALVAACQARQPFTEMTEDALREMLVPLGVTRIQLDPVAVVAGHPASERAA
jgi:hypothetical protein